jgi:hypothetical protein
VDLIVKFLKETKMHTYVKLKDGRIMTIWSDNTTEETMNVYQYGEEFDEFTTTEEIKYSDIVNIDCNLAII